MYLAKATLVKGGVILSGGSLSAYGISKAVATTEDNKPVLDANLDDSSDVVVEWRNEKIVSIADKSNFDTSTGEYKNGDGTFGYAYGRFMLSSDGNEKFWKEQEKDLQKNQNMHDEFKNLKDKPGELKNKCKEIYGRQKNTVSDDLERSVWSYCSPVYSKPNSVSYDDDKYNGKWAKLNGNKDVLMRAHVMSQNAWDVIFRLFKEHLEDNDKKEKINTKLQSISDYNGLLNFCDEAYKSEATETSSIYGNNAREYCLLDASAKLEKYPTEPEK